MILSMGIFLLMMGTTAFSSASAGAAMPGDWSQRSFPYRVRITLDRAIKGSAAIDLQPQTLLEALRPVSVDVTVLDTFAFEKAMLVDSATGQRVGGFHLTPVGKPLEIDGNFEAYAAKANSPWKPYGAWAANLQPIIHAGKSFNALWIAPKKITNSGLRQGLTLEPGAFYLLEYQINSDPIDNNLGIQIIDPKKRLFAEEHHSYRDKLTPTGQWTTQRVLYRPDIAKPDLRIVAAFTGRCGIGAIRLQKVALALTAALPAATDRLDLYCMMRAGHRLPVPTEALAARTPPSGTMAKVRSLKAEAADLNPDAVAVESNGVRAWTVASDLPLTTAVLPRTAPAGGTGARKVDVSLFRGGAQTVLVAVKTGSDRATFGPIHCDLPVSFKVEQLAEIPVYNGPSPDGKLIAGARLIETRLDALVPVNFDLAPPSSTGIQLLALTFSADRSVKPGHYQGEIAIDVQSPHQAALRLPIEVSVAPLTIDPMRHFGTLFGGQLFMVRSQGKPFTQPSITVAEYCGYSSKNLEPYNALSLSTADQADARLRPIRELARKYYNRMLDYCVNPQTPTLYSPYTYKVIDQGTDKAPGLADWDFTAYDQAIDALVLKRDMPVLVIFHSNGHQMDKLRLANGVTYTLLPANGKPAWRHLPREQYFKLVSEFFEAVAAHLDKKGVLNRAIYVIDESGSSTYDLIRDYVAAMKKGAHAQRIRVLHTNQHVSLYTRRDKKGRLLLNGVVDIPASENDDLANYFLPKWNGHFKQVDQQWVYYVESDHLNLTNAGLSTLVTPLQLGHFGVDGWYDWASFLWSLPYPVTDVCGPKFPSGPVINPWKNPFYHHGPGVLSFFYPPDPRGPATKPTDRIIPSYRLALMRDGIQRRALLDVLEKGRDDAGQTLHVNQSKLKAAHEHLRRLWADNPVQWYLGYHDYRVAGRLLFESVEN
jgi:hypothetical protein